MLKQVQHDGSQFEWRAIASRIENRFLKTGKGLDTFQTLFGTLGLTAKKSSHTGFQGDRTSFRNEMHSIN
ncbi:MAG: hypothetical protein Tsb004_23540 [Allomuricauda sp.]